MTDSRLRLTLCLGVWLSVWAPVSAVGAEDPLLALGLGDLMKIKVITVQRRESELGKTAAPTFVLTSDDIRRSGATMLPDLLRLVPGVEVARVNGNSWAISARGLNNGAANKLLVLIDGRTVYSQLFAGVFWDVQDIPLESIDRIEVILGPGGSLWGANAVNGIINIIRKPASQRQGTAAAVTGGSEDRFIGDVSQGWNIGEKVQAATYAHYREFDDMKRVGQSGGNDDAGRYGSAGFRADGAAGKNTWQLSADGYKGEFDANRTVFSLTPPSATLKNDFTDVNGANLLGKVNTKVESGIVSLLAYYDRTERRIPDYFSEVRNTGEVDIQHELNAGRRNTFTYGTSFRATADQVGNSFSIAWDPSSAFNRIYSVFAQDEFRITPRLAFTAGSKLEHNDYTGWELQPSGRLGFQATPDHFLWASVSQAVRTPTRLDADAHVVGAVQPVGPTTLEVQGGERFDSEHVTAYEAGYRAQPTERTYFSLSTFYNSYRDLRSVEQSPPDFSTDPVPHNRVSFFEDNKVYGESYGGEFAPRVQLFSWWKVEAQYSLIHLRLHDETGSQDFSTVRTERNDPQQQFTFMSNWNLPHRVELDGYVRWVDKLKNLNIGDYTAIDLRLAWAATEKLSTEIAGRNLFAPPHREFSGTAEVEPSVYGKISWHTR